MYICLMFPVLFILYCNIRPWLGSKLSQTRYVNQTGMYKNKTLSSSNRHIYNYFVFVPYIFLKQFP